MCSSSTLGTEAKYFHLGQKINKMYHLAYRAKTIVALSNITDYISLIYQTRISTTNKRIRNLFGKKISQH